jgi:zinc/manganese transport system permease protein
MSELVPLLWAPFLMCLVLTAIHAYLGLHVLAREIVFVDIALAQTAALGATAAFLVGFEPDSWMSYFLGLAATLAASLVLAATGRRARRVSQEAIIGVLYAVAAAASVLMLANAPHGAEQLRALLVGNVLSVDGAEVARVGALYAIVGVFHWFAREPFMLLSTDRDAAVGAGWSLRLWDFLFYASFGVVVASSVRIAGVLLGFAYLIAPALAASILGGPMRRRLLVGWAFGSVTSLVGIAGSAFFDLPTGATVVCAFGLLLVLVAGAARFHG